MNDGDREPTLERGRSIACAEPPEATPERRIAHRPWTGQRQGSCPPRTQLARHLFAEPWALWAGGVPPAPASLVIGDVEVQGPLERVTKIRTAVGRGGRRKVVDQLLDLVRQRGDKVGNERVSPHVALAEILNALTLHVERHSFLAVIALRSTLASIARATAQQLNRVVRVRGINIGGGAWVRLGWYNVDTRHSLDETAKARLDASSRFSFDDASIDVVFSSHFFEHVDDATALNLFGEAYRVLRSGGVFRIAVPDFELALTRFAAGDDAFFDGGDVGFAPRYENWSAHGVAPTLENKLSFLFCGYSNKDDHGRWPPWRQDPSYYCGPIHADPGEIRRLAAARDVGALSRYVVSLAPKDAFDYGHVNWWTEAKFRDLLTRVGFPKVTRSAYRGSSSRELRGAAFDNRPAATLYVEAIK